MTAGRRLTTLPAPLRWLLVACPILIGVPLAMWSESSTSRAAGAMTLLLGIGLVAVVALTRRDPATVLTGMLALLFLVPANYVIVGPLKSVGSPPLLLGLLALALWASGRVLGVIRAEALNPLRWTLWFYVIGLLASYAAAMLRSLSVDESKSVTRSIYPALAMLGIALLAADGLTSVERITTLLKRLVGLATAQAVIGLLEIGTGLNWREVTDLPGLRPNTEVTDQLRGQFVRLQAAAAHPIEFSVALAVVAPLALHFALHSPDRRSRRIFWACFTLIVLALPLTLSRSGILGAAVALLVYSTAMTGRQRANLGIMALLGLGGFQAAFPGILGTLKWFILAGSSDNSVTGRLDDYARLPGLMEGHYVFGRGFGTFQPLVYFYLDNQYVMSLLNNGVLGVLGLLALFLVGMGLARGARRRWTDPRRRSLCQAVVGGIACLAVTAGTFDEFGFLQCAFELFLLVGVASALWTVARASVSDAVEAPEVAPASRPATAEPVLVSR
jgi:hypothetical protein